MSSLNLSKYNSEVASAIVEAKLKLNDVSAAVTLCSEMHTTYAEFSKLLLEHWVKTLSLKKDEKVIAFYLSLTKLMTECNIQISC